MIKFILKIKRWATTSLNNQYNIPVRYSHYLSNAYQRDPFKVASKRDMFYLWNYNFRYGFFGKFKVKFLKKIISTISKYENKTIATPIKDEDFDNQLSHLGASNAQNSTKN